MDLSLRTEQNSKEKFDRAVVSYAVSLLSNDKHSALVHRTAATDILSKFTGDHRHLLESSSGLGDIVVGSSQDLAKRFPKWLMTREGKLFYARFKERYPEGFEKKVQVDMGAEIGGDPFAPYESDLKKIVEQTKEKYAAVAPVVTNSVSLHKIPKPSVQAMLNAKIPGDPESVNYEPDLTKITEETKLKYAALETLEKSNEINQKQSKYLHVTFDTPEDTVAPKAYIRPISVEDLPSQISADTNTVDVSVTKKNTLIREALLGVIPMPENNPPTPTPTLIEDKKNLSELDVKLREALVRIDDASSILKHPETCPEPTSFPNAIIRSPDNNEYVDKLREFAAEKKFVESRLEHASCVMHEQKLEIEKCTEELSEAKQKLAEWKDLDPAKLQHDISDMESLLAAERQSKLECEATLKNSLDSFKSKLRSAKHEVQTLRQKIMTEERNAKEAEYGLRRAQDEFRRRDRELTFKARQAESVNQEKDNIIRRLEEELNVMRDRAFSNGSSGIHHYHGDSRELEVKKHIIVTKEREIDELRKAKMSLEQRLREAEKMNSQIKYTSGDGSQRPITEVHKENNKLIRELDAANNRNAKILIDFESCRQDLRTIRSKNVSLEAAVRAKCGDEVMSMYGHIETLLKNGSKICQALTRQREEIKTLSCINSQMKETCDVALREKNISFPEQEIVESHEEKEEIGVGEISFLNRVEICGEKLSKVHELNAELKDLYNLCDNYFLEENINSYKTLKQKFSASEVDKSELEKERDNLAHKITELERNIITLKSEIETFRQRDVTINTEKQNLERRIVSLRGIIQSLTIERDKYKKEKENLETK